MNIKTTLTAISLLSVLSFGASAATSINSEQAANRVPMGTITASEIGGTPMDMNRQLSKEADAKGASSYRIIEARTGDSWHATAELYK
ncbi:membrane protein [Salmonella enterica subsp. enterica serovar Choleraesuis]|nr:membrane protein [Salmonella enterica subsp. enterica serovar Choleraesuis]